MPRGGTRRGRRIPSAAFPGHAWSRSAPAAVARRIRQSSPTDAPHESIRLAFGPRGVVYVSCDPATQTRDLRDFLADGYVLTAVQPFDIFPQTRHLECVVTLRREA